MHKSALSQPPQDHGGAGAGSSPPPAVSARSRAMSSSPHAGDSRPAASGVRPRASRLLRSAPSVTSTCTVSIAAVPTQSPQISKGNA